MQQRYLWLLLTICSAPSWAKLAEHGGLSGEISVVAGFSENKSHVSTSNNPVLTDLNQSTESDDSSFVAPLGNLKYTFGRGLNQQVYIGTSRSDVAVGTLAAEIGYKEAFRNGMEIDVSYLPTIMDGEEWSDPFVTGRKRDKTDVDGNAFRLRANNIFGSIFSIDSAYIQRDIESEHSGEALGLSPSQRDQLDRNRSSVYVKTSARLRLPTQTMVTPSFIYIDSSADGDAMSYESYGGELSVFQFLNRQSLALTLGYATRDYDQSHPVFSKTRSDDTLKLFLAYEYQIGQQWSLISLAGYNSTDSNIEYYDQSNYMVSVGANYKF